MRIPTHGLTRDEVLDRIQAMKADDLDTRGGRTWAYVYDTGRREIDEVAEEAYVACLHENGLDPTVFPSLLGMETDVVAMASAHLGGDEEVVGNFTSGGTESCMLAVKTARDHFAAKAIPRAERVMDRAKLVLPDTGHASFQKAAHYFDMDVVLVPVDPKTFKVHPEAIAEAIDDRTALVVASAPSYAHGCVDPIPEIAEVCRERGVLLHVDACVGGWLLPYMERLGVEVTPFDFRVDGVTSISMDLHKYAYCPKGASVVLYRDRSIRRHQLYACASWTGYTVINTTIQSTKGGGALGAAWATLHFVGDEGYLDIADRTLRATRRLIDGLREIPGVEVLGSPEMSMIAFTSDEFSVFEVIDLMKERRWYVQPQLRFGSSPENIHLSVTATSLERVDELLADLAECCEKARATPPDPDLEKLCETLAELSPDDFTPETYAEMLEMAGLGGGAELPEEMAEINTMMNALRPELRERLLVEFLNDLYRHDETG